MLLGWFRGKLSAKALSTFSRKIFYLLHLFVKFRLQFQSFQFASTCVKTFLWKLIFHQLTLLDSASSVLCIWSLCFNCSNLHLVYTNKKDLISSKQKHGLLASYNCTWQGKFDNKWWSLADWALAQKLLSSIHISWPFA